MQDADGDKTKTTQQKGKHTSHEEKYGQGSSFALPHKPETQGFPLETTSFGFRSTVSPN